MPALLRFVAIPFVGAGASAGLYPLWSELLDRLLSETAANGRLTDSDRTFFDSLPSADLQASWIEKRLGRTLFENTLREVFKPHRGPDERYFTRVHELLVRVPFGGYVTTNYDHGLLRAKAFVHDDLPTGWSTWQDTETIARWNNGQIFKEDARPIFFAHGSYDRGPTIVLSESGYAKVYRTGPARRLTERLWTGPPWSSLDSASTISG